MIIKNACDDKNVQKNLKKHQKIIVWVRRRRMREEKVYVLVYIASKILIIKIQKGQNTQWLVNEKYLL